MRRFVRHFFLMASIVGGLNACQVITRDDGTLNDLLDPNLVELPQGLKNGVIAHFAFQGNLNDVSGHGQNLLSNGNPALVARSNQNQVVQMDGIDDSLNLTSLAGLNQESFSGSMWIRSLNPVRTLDVPPYQGQIFSTISGNFQFDTQSADSNGRDGIRYFAQGPDLEEGRQTGITLDNEWHHFAFSYLRNDAGTSRSTITLYFDGAFIDKIDLGSQIVLGFSQAGDLGVVLGNQMHGEMDEILVYNRGLRLDEINEIRNLQAPLFQ